MCDKLAVQVQYFYDFLKHTKEECEAEAISSFEPGNLFKTIRICDELLQEFDKTFNQTLYQPKENL